MSPWQVSETPTKPESLRSPKAEVHRKTPNKRINVGRVCEDGDIALEDFDKADVSPIREYTGLQCTRSEEQCRMQVVS